MINDDKPLVRVEEERAFVFGSPWCGKHKLGCNGSARLKAVVELTRDSRNHIEAVKEPFPCLMQHVYTPQYVEQLKCADRQRAECSQRNL